MKRSTLLAVAVVVTIVVVALVLDYYVLGASSAMARSTSCTYSCGDPYYPG